MPFFSWKNFLLICFMSVFWLLSVDAFSHKITSKWLEFFSYYDGYRLPSSITAFLPFTLDTLKQDQAKTVIIFPGDSTSGGLLYHHSQAIPAYLNQNLRNTHTYNLALSGAHLSEQYLIIKETIEYADIIIFPIHYSFFTGRGDKGAFYFHPEIVNSLTQATIQDLEPLGLSPKPKLNLIADKFFSKIWYTYKVRHLLPQITLGKPTKFFLKDKLISMIPSKSLPPKPSIDPTKPFPDQSPIVQQEILNQNKLLWQKITPVSSDNTNLQYLQKIISLQKSSQKLFFAYFVPLDLKTLNKNQIIDLSTYNQIITSAKQLLDQNKIPYIDFNQQNPAQLTPADFYNPDHLMPLGNQKVATVLVEKLNQLK